MTPEQTARRYEDLAGFELVDYAEAALPLWQLNVEAVSVVRRGLQPMKEFALRSLEAGLTMDDLPGFLGLDEAIVRGVLADLLSERQVALVESAAQVTDTGRKALKEGISSPASEILTLFFDGVLRRPVAWSAIDFAYSREVEDGVVVEIPATPALRPEIQDLSLPDVDQVLHDQVGGRSEMNRDILRLKRIVRRRRHFRRGVALIFRSRKGEVRTRFIVNGVPDEQLEQSFAERGGNLRKGLVRAFSEAYVKANLRAHLGQEAARRVLEPTVYSARQTQLSIATLKLAGVRRRLAMSDRGELAQTDRPTPEALHEAEAAERAARQDLDAPEARPAAVYEKVEFLERALVEPRKSLSISTRGLAPHYVDDAFINALRQLIDRGVQVTITAHRTVNEWRSRGRDWARAVDGVTALADAHPDRVRLRIGTEERYFHLAWDDRVALIANRPMLSNFGRTRAFDQFAGFVLQEAKLIGDYLARVNR